MNILDTREEVKDRARKFVQELKNQVYILGTNKYGISVAKWLEKNSMPLGGFINDFEEISSYKGYKVFKSSQLPKKISIINCITEGRVITAEENIAKINPVSHIDYFSLQLLYPEELVDITFLEDTNKILNHVDKLSLLSDKLEDNVSRVTLSQILNLRFNRDIKALKNFKFNIEGQYFENFLNINQHPIFVDGGGYNGKTTSKFIELFPQYKKIYYFERNRRILDIAKNLLQGNQNIKFFEKGLWSSKAELYFDDSLEGASKLSLQGSLKIETVSLDQVIKGSIDFIKLDIEGAEYEALKGSENLIKTCKPTVAVCVYHNQEDFTRIPELLLNYNPLYKIYLRHYNQGVFETIMYFV